MLALYCAADGADHDSLAAERRDECRLAGEAVLIAHGKLKAGPFRCDSCNLLLERGDDATLLAAYPPLAVPASGIDFAREGGRYFDMNRAAIRS